jgi:hypothetical protein
VEKKPAILDGHDRALKVWRDVSERNVVTLLIETEPRLAVRGQERRVADTSV